MIVNILWPFVPAAVAIHFARPDLHVWVFALNYIAMVPSANLLGFAGGELAKKLPKVRMPTLYPRISHFNLLRYLASS
jgi:Ca2+:H+ antiporter